MPIVLSPSLLKDQAGQMEKLMGEYDSLFGSVSSNLQSLNANWSENLSNNFSAKIANAQKSFSSVVATLQYGASAAQSSAISFENIDDSLAKLVGKAGPLGSIIKEARSIVKSDYNKDSKSDSLKEFIKTGKSASSLISAVEKYWTTTEKMSKLSNFGNGYAAKIWGKHILGLNKYKLPHGSGVPSKCKSFLDRVDTNLRNITQDGPLADFKKGGLKGGLAWTGLALSVMSNGVSNYQEYKSGKISATRAVIETGTETAVDITKNWLIGGAVAATTLALVPGAPVVVVGALTVAASAGLDAIAKAVTKKFLGEEMSATELISDSLIEFGKIVGNGAVSVGKKALNAGKNLVSGVAGFLKKHK